MSQGDSQREEGSRFLPDFDKRGGLLPCVVQDVPSGQILMLGYVNREALESTRKSGRATFFSTSRQSLWTKGESSGNYLVVREILVDCDQDALVYRVEMAGEGACHTRDSDGKARRSCFYRRLEDGQFLSFLSYDD
jgi:phosphoribosyl-AMP cyclohydrolase